MRILAIILIVLGIAGLIYSQVSWTQKETVLELGDVQVQTEKEKQISWPVIVPAVLLAGGVGLLFVRRKR